MTGSHVQQTKGKANHRTAKIVTAIVLAVLVVVGILAAFVFKDDNTGLKAAPSADSLKTILTDAVTGKESSLSSTQVNQLLAYEMEKKGAASGALSSVYLSTNADNTVNFYAPVTVNGMHFGITAVTDLTFDSKSNQLVATVKSMHVGRLGVPVNWALNLAKDKLPSGIKVDGDKLLVNSSLLSFPIEGTKGSLTVSGLQVKDNKFLLKTTGMAGVVKDYLAQAKDQLQELLK
jgi:uncharacterized protein YpmS